MRGKTKFKRRLRLDFQLTLFRVSINKAILRKIFEGFYIEIAHVSQARFGARSVGVFARDWVVRLMDAKWRTGSNNILRCVI